MISIKQANADLLWYYNAAHSDLGICSSFGNMISSAFGFSPDNSINYTEDKILKIIQNPKQPIKKLKRIEQALHIIPLYDRRVLDALYFNYKFPPQLTSTFGIKTGAAIFNTIVTQQQPLVKLCSQFLAKTISQQNKEILNKINIQKEIIYDNAHQAYIRAKI